MSNVSLALKVSDFSLTHDYISNILGLTPTASYLKGNEYYVGPPDKRIKKKYEYNCWEYRMQFNNNSVWVQTLIDKFSEEFIFRKQEAFRNLKDICELELYIGIFFKEGERLESFHFELPLLKLFSDLNIEIDIDQHIFSKTLL